MSTATAVRARLGGVDRLRGLAVLLMVADHCAAVAGWGGLWRLGPTRLALPLFCFAAVSVWSRRSWSRRSIGRAGVLAAAETALNPVIGLGWPGPVLLIFGSLVLLDPPWMRSTRAGRSWVLVLLTVGLLQALYWPLGGLWSGYQPGLVLVWCGLAGLIGVGPVDELGDELPSTVLEVAGRRASELYVLHLVVLAGVVVA